MNILKVRNNLFMYFLSITILLVSLFIVRTLLNEKITEDTKDDVYISSIKDITEEYEIDVDYPRYKSDKINKIITDYVYNYVKDFKKDTTINKKLTITYEIYTKDSYSNLVFYINNSISNDKRHNILINIDTESIANINDMFNEFDLLSKLDDLAYYKYQTSVYNIIKDTYIENMIFIISNEKVTVYFDNVTFTDIDYKPIIEIDLINDIYTNENKVFNETSNYVAFTFDDGPSEYTEEILKTLEVNESSATFFMLGSEMETHDAIVKKVFESNSEVASHSFSHKNFNEITIEEVKEEISKTESIFNEITDSSIPYLRPPYGEISDEALSIVNTPIILWNVDPKDWLYLDANKTYEDLLNNIQPGSIVLLHDTYNTTYEAIKMIIPKLRSMNYEIVSVTELLKHYNKQPISKEKISNLSN